MNQHSTFYLLHQNVLLYLQYLFLPHKIQQIKTSLYIGCKSAALQPILSLNGTIHILALVNALSAFMVSLVEQNSQIRNECIRSAGTVITQRQVDMKA